MFSVFLQLNFNPKRKGTPETAIIAVVISESGSYIAAPFSTFREGLKLHTDHIEQHWTPEYLCEEGFADYIQGRN